MLTQIPARAASRLLDSVAFLNAEHGVLLNAMITLNFDQLGLSDTREKVSAHTKLNVSLQRRLARFADRYCVAPEGEHFFVYAHERVRSEGHHIHQLIAAPYGMRPELGVWLERWRCRHFPEGDPKALHLGFEPREGRLDLRVENQARMVRYILKTVVPAGTVDRDGQSAEVHELMKLQRRSSQPMDVKRVVGVSENISKRAQWDVGWQPPTNWEDMLSEMHIRDWHDRQRSAAFTAHLRSINV